MPMTTSHNDDWHAHVLDGTQYNYLVGPRYLAFFTADPTKAGLLTSEQGTGAARYSATFGAAANGSASNTGAIAIDTSSGWDGSPITHVGVIETSVVGAGILKWYDVPVGGPISYTPGDTIDIPIGNIKVRFYDSDGAGGNLGAAGTKIVVAAANLWIDHSLGVSQWTVSAAANVSLHTAAPASDANEFTAGGGGYLRQAWASDTPSNSGDIRRISHSNTLSWTDIQSTPQRAWGIYQGSQICIIRDEGSDRAVQAGSNITAPAGRLIVDSN